MNPVSMVSKLFGELGNDTDQTFGLIGDRSTQVPPPTRFVFGMND